MFQIDILSKSSCLLAIYWCCLRSHDHRRPIYERIVLHSSTIIDFKAIYPHPAYSDPPPLINFFLHFQTPRLLQPPTYSNPPGNKALMSRPTKYLRIHASKRRWIIRKSLPERLWFQNLSVNIRLKQGELCRTNVFMIYIQKAIKISPLMNS